MRLAFFPCLLLFVAQPIVKADPETLEAYTESLRPTLEHSVRRDFFASDGFRLSYTIFQQESGHHPIVILPGKGETVYDYVEMAKDLMSRGYGPILLLEPRSQGHSDRTNPEHPSMVDIASFDRYVDDLLEWLKGPIAQFTEGRSPDIIAHSMGGAIVNLAVLKNPTMANRIAYVAPMFDIKINHHLDSFQDEGAAILMELICLVGCGSRIELSASSPDTSNLNHPRRAYPRTNGRSDNITATAVSPRWLHEAIKATQRIRGSADRQVTPSLIVSGTRDEVIDNSTLKNYACEAANCTLVELRATHGIHHSGNSVYHQLIDHIDGFFKGTSQPLTSSACNTLMALAEGT